MSNHRNSSVILIAWMTARKLAILETVTPDLQGHDALYFPLFIGLTQRIIMIIYLFFLCFFDFLQPFRINIYRYRTEYQLHKLCIIVSFLNCPPQSDLWSSEAYLCVCKCEYINCHVHFRKKSSLFSNQDTYFGC